MIYYKELDHASTKLRSPRCAVSKLETMKTDDVSSRADPRAYKPGELVVKFQFESWRKPISWPKDCQRDEFLLSFFALNKPSMDWMRPIHIGEDHVCSSCLEEKVRAKVR